MDNDPRISNIPAECALLGGLMIENRLIDKAADIVRPEDFAEPFNGRLFRTILRQHNLGKPSNPVSLKPLVEHADR